ncbi:hypothetical protein E4U42_004025 [Claviceps africana]|uniref:C2H2-type domain-containing protein n=1 Tax=Claviceps africana TaxID=83212 RepID=A0A8K0J6Y2_9HYPO|nr:hypothetical protein E4U42_004025 [Claviceps africana]
MPVKPDFTASFLQEDVTPTDKADDYSYPQSMATNPSAMFPFVHTEPSTDLLNGSWSNAGDGSPSFPEYPDHGSCHSGEVEDYLYTSGHTTPRGSRLEHTQSMESVWNNPRIAAQSSSMAQAMARADSTRSSGSSLSQSSDMSRGNAPAFGNVPQSAAVAGTMSAMDSCLLLAADAAPANPHMYWSELNMDMSLPAAAGPFCVSDASPMHMIPAQMHLGPESVLPDGSSPASWDCLSSSISRTSSPATIDEAWLAGPLSPHSPGIVDDSPCAERKACLGSESNKDKVHLDEGSLALSNGVAPRRHGSDSESSARDHTLYKNVTPGPDGLFHCPWEGKASCNHKAEKLKCNYDKFVDSHLKPYRCKAESCEGARFSSTACLLRHEREAHGLHGHGDKPFLCVYEGCERAVPGNGFPRQWNLRDHMKRVHNDHGSAGGSPPSGGSSQSVKGRKRRTEVAEAPTGARKATLKSMPVAETTKHVPAKPLLEQWLDQRRVVEEIVRGLHKPDDARSLQQISDVQKRLAYMATMTKELSSVASTTTAAAETSRAPYTSG